MNWKNFGYVPLPKEDLENEAYKIFGEPPSNEQLWASMAQVEQKHLDDFLLGLFGHGSITIGVCFNESDGKFINKYSKQSSMSGYNRRSISSAIKNSIIRSFRTPDEVDAYFMALDDVNAGYEELSQEAIEILKQLQPNYNG